MVLTLPAHAYAENMLMLRSTDNFTKTLQRLKNSIEEHGYEFAHVQRCDGGLKGMGYKTESYRTVFFGKLDEVRDLTDKFPELIPFLPLKIAIVEEGDETILFTVNPTELEKLIQLPELSVQFKRWENDLRSVFSDIRL